MPIHHSHRVVIVPGGKEIALNEPTHVLDRVKTPKVPLARKGCSAINIQLSENNTVEYRITRRMS